MKALREIEALEVYDSTRIDVASVRDHHFQPCFSPIWDTALLVNALVEAGMPQDHPALQKAAAWLLVSKQTKTVGDWIVSSPLAKPGGWYFQFENEMYPDVDDSAVVMMAFESEIPGHDNMLQAHSSRDTVGLGDARFRRRLGRLRQR